MNNIEKEVQAEMDHFEIKAKGVLLDLLSYYLENPRDKISEEFHSIIQRFKIKGFKCEKRRYHLVRE